MLELTEAERVLDLSSADARAVRERMTLLLVQVHPTPELLAEMKRLEAIYTDMVKMASELPPEDRDESALVRAIVAHVPRQLDHLRAAISQATATLERKGVV